MKEITIITTEDRLSKIMNIVGDYVIDHDNDSIVIAISKLKWPGIKKRLQAIN